MIVSPCEFFNINFPLPLWDVFVLLSVHTFLPNPLSLCMGQFLRVEFTFSFFPFLSLPLSTYFSHSLPGQVAQQSGLEDITLKSDCLGPDLSSAAYCEKTLDKYLHISELQFSHLKYSDNNRAQS